MSNIRCIDFNDLCRICTVSSEQKINVFSPEGRNKNLTMKITECLPLSIDEKDRLPKVICGQCVQYVEHMFEFRNICSNSQAMLNSCLDTATTQNGGKVYIKDPISGTGKSLSVLGVNGNLPTVVPTPAATLTFQTPITSATSAVQNTLQSTDLLTTIMQAVGGLKPGGNQQYTITVDNKSANNNAAVEYKIEAVPTISTISTESNVLKNEKQSALEEFIKLKPDIKITPLGKKEAQKPQQQQQQTLSHIQIQQAMPDQQQQQTALQIQLPHHIQQLQQQIQQQQLQQQIQQLTSQWQAQQQFTITTPSTLNATGTSSTQQLGNNTPMTTTATEELSPSKSKKPKLNFVLTTPQTQTFASALQQPQIKLELQPTTTTAGQQQTSQQINAAALLSNLAAPQSSATNVLSPNKCYLPITIRDENSDQQIVAHIDAKNFVFPTTYQVQMKLQRELATADGQSIMQFSPTSIPATLQLTPQSVANTPTFQTTASNINSQIRPFLIEKQELLQPQQTQSQQPQQQLHPQQQQQQYQPPQKRQITAEVTSQQIIRSVNYSQPVMNITQSNNNTVNATVAAEERKVFKAPLQKQEKYKGFKRNSNLFEITPTTNFTQQIMEQVKQQQLQKQQAKEQELAAQAETKQGSSPPQQHAGLTVQRMQAKGSDAKSTVSIASSGSSPTKLPLLNKQNITISRISSQNSQNAQQKPQQQPQQQQQPHRQQKQQQHQNQQQHVAQKQMSSVKFVQQQQKKTITPNVAQQQLYPQQQQQQQLAQQQQQVQPKHQQLKSLSSVTQQESSSAAKVQAQLVTTKKVRNKQMTGKVLTTITTPQTAEAATNVVVNSAITATSASSQKPGAITSPLTDTQASPGQNDNSSGAISSAVSSQHICQSCGRGFKKKEHLTQHVKLHAGLRPFKCTEENCNKAFSRKEHLMRHCVSHTGKKMFSCDICSKPFSRKDNLNKHRRVHNSQTTELIYKCEICQKSFAVKAYYDKHKEMHSKSDTKTAAGTAVKQKTKTTGAAAQSPQKASLPPPPPSIKTDQPTQKQQTQQRLHILQTSSTAAQTQSAQPQQQQIMHVQLQPQVVTTQDLAGNTITITQAPDPNLPTSLANFVQLGYSQFQSPTPGQIVCTIEK